MADAPRERIAKLSGIWAVPGVSKNRRLYKPAHIRAAAEEAQALIDAGQAPTVLSMLTHHGARDPKAGDVRATAGHLTKVGVDGQGRGTWEADIADTDAGRDVAALTLPDKNGKPRYLRGVSMASVWRGEPMTVRGPDGEPCVTSNEGFSLKGIDFTHNQGVPDAQITTSELVEAALEPLIYESIEEAVHMVPEGDGTETAPATGSETNEAGNAPGNGSLPYGSSDDAGYADPGWQKDGKKRYPLKVNGKFNAKRIRAAWSYINQADNAAKYSKKQVARIKGKIKAAAKKVNVDIAEDLRLLGTEILEAMGALSLDSDAGKEADEAYASMSMDNGPGTVSISTYGVDAQDLDKVGRIVAMAALAALSQLDPDMDGDLDLDRFDTDEDDNDMDGTQCAACGADVPDGSNFCPGCGTAIAVTETSSATREKEATVPDNKQTTGAAANETVTLTDDERKVVEAAAEAARKAALEALGKTEAPTETAEEKAAREAQEAKLADARKVLEEAGELKPTETPGAKTAPAVTAEATESTALTADDVQKRIDEALGKQNAANEELLTEARKIIAHGGGRRGMIAKAIAEQSPEEIYGDADLTKASLQDLTKVADAAVAPLLGG